MSQVQYYVESGTIENLDRDIELIEWITFLELLNIQFNWFVSSDYEYEYNSQIPLKDNIDNARFIGLIMENSKSVAVSFDTLKEISTVFNKNGIIFIWLYLTGQKGENIIKITCFDGGYWLFSSNVPEIVEKAKNFFPKMRVDTRL